MPNTKLNDPNGAAETILSPEVVPGAQSDSAQRMVGPCQKAVSAILLSAINGQDATLWTEDRRYIRWGLVEKRIHAAIQEKWPNSPGERPARVMPVAHDNQKI